MKVLLEITSSRWKLDAGELTRFAQRAGRAAGLRGELSVLVTSSRRLRTLNREFRGKDAATDVLSFPAGQDGVAGDLAISAEIAERNARSLGHPAQDEIKVLLLHGMLHLAGHDHERDSGEMQRKEDALRKRLGVADSLIARAQKDFAQKNGAQKSASREAAGKRRVSPR